MKVIGITGGIGSGKSVLLNYIRQNYKCRIVLADEAAHKVKEPGQPCYEQLVRLLSTDILNEDGTIHKGKMAGKIFNSKELLTQVNQIIHPAVREMILNEVKEAEKEGCIDFFFVEAALLIECGYLALVDEMWYVYAKEEIRRERLRTSRSYSNDKISAIMKEQLSEESFRQHCTFVIDNSGELEAAYRQIDKKLGEYL